MRDIRYKWRDGNKSVSISNGVQLPQFRVLGHRQKQTEINLTTGIDGYYPAPGCKLTSPDPEELLSPHATAGGWILYSTYPSRRLDKS